MGSTRLSGETERRAIGGKDVALLRGAVEVDFDAGVEALRTASKRLTSLVRAIDEPDKRTRGLDWSLADTAAHVLLTLRYDLGTMTGRRETYAVEDDAIAAGRAHNAASLRAESERDPLVLARLIAEAVEEFIEEARRRDPLSPAPLSGDNAMTVANLVGTLLGEMIVHGYDIARTTKQKLTIDPDAARLAVYATSATLGLAVNPDTTKELSARLEMRIRGGESFVIHIDDGTARTERPDGGADLYMSADPIAYLLVGFGRSGPLAQVARGRMIAWGKKPLIAAKLPTYFRNP
jgi:uncharacterized protein (TIGR03083 family)